MSIDALTGRLAGRSRGALVERAAAILRQVLVPSAVVAHQRSLPEVGTGRLCECDIVIRSGVDRASVLTIGEVWERDAPVDLHTYRDWLEKRERLGAARLIALAVSGFSDAVLEAALAEGDRVRLMGLCAPEAWPAALGEREYALVRDLGSERSVEVASHSPNFNAVALSTTLPVFKLSTHPAPVSLDQITGAVNADNFPYKRGEPDAPDYDELRTYRLEFSAAGEQLWHIHEGRQTAIAAITIVERVKLHKTLLPLTLLATEQRARAGVVAWLAVAHGTLDGAEVLVNVFYLPQADGKMAVKIGSHVVV